MLQYDGRFENECVFYMVFEYMDKDLDHYIHQCATTGMGEPKVKVRSLIISISVIWSVCHSFCLSVCPVFWTVMRIWCRWW